MTHIKVFYECKNFHKIYLFWEHTQTYLGYNMYLFNIRNSLTVYDKQIPISSNRRILKLAYITRHNRSGV